MQRKFSVYQLLSEFNITAKSCSNESSEQADSYSASKLSSILESEDRISIPDPTLLQTQPRSITQSLLQLVVSVKIVVLALVAILQPLLDLLLIVIRHFTPRTK